MPNTEANRDELIREMAYYLWSANGSAPGSDLEYWEQAKRIVDDRAPVVAPITSERPTYYQGGFSAQPPAC